jgi:type I restriction enzyme M protein
MLSNPPFGVEWKTVQKQVTDEHKKQGFNGRFGPGLPRISDGSLLFLLHMISKMAPITDANPEGARIGIVLNGSPLFSGDAGSGESDIRRWIIEQDYLEAIIGLPDQLFFNTGIYTYIWVVTNRKSPRRKGKVLLVNATGMYEKMRKSLGNKRNFIPAKHVAAVSRLYADAKPGPAVKVFDNEDFGYRQITVERPARFNFLNDDIRRHRFYATTEWDDLGLKDEEAAKVLRAGISKVEPDRKHLVRDALDAGFGRLFAKAGLKPHTPLYKALIRSLGERDSGAEPFLDLVKGKWAKVPDSGLRDTENVPLKEDIHEWFAREVTPFRPDAWIDEEKTKIGYVIPFTRHFYEYTPIRSLEELDNEIRTLETDILGMLKAVMS